MISSTKPEVHRRIISQRRQKGTEQRPQAACTKYLVNFGPAVSEICEWTDRQTDSVNLFLTAPYINILTYLLTYLDRHTDTHTDRQTDRQTDRHAHHNTSQPFLECNSAGLLLVQLDRGRASSTSQGTWSEDRRSWLRHRRRRGRRRSLDRSCNYLRLFLFNSPTPAAAAAHFTSSDRPWPFLSPVTLTFDLLTHG